jgi:hypothetical protein
MANVSRLAERVVGCHAFFCEAGTEVSGQTISETVAPNYDPDTDWPSIGDVLEGAKFEKEVSDDSYMKPGTSAWVRQTVQYVTGNSLTFKTRQMSGLADRLLFGLADAITENVPVTPFVQSDPRIFGWLLVQGRKMAGATAGDDDFRLLAWVALSLAGAPAFESKALSPELRAEFLSAAADSIIFPVLPS